MCLYYAFLRSSACTWWHSGVWRVELHRGSLVSRTAPFCTSGSTSSQKTSQKPAHMLCGTCENKTATPKKKQWHKLSVDWLVRDRNWPVSVRYVRFFRSHLCIYRPQWARTARKNLNILCYLPKISSVWKSLLLTSILAHYRQTSSVLTFHNKSLRYTSIHWVNKRAYKGELNSLRHLVTGN